MHCIVDLTAKRSLCSKLRWSTLMGFASLQHHLWVGVKTETNHHRCCIIHMFCGMFMWFFDYIIVHSYWWVFSFLNIYLIIKEFNITYVHIYKCIWYAIRAGPSSHSRSIHHSDLLRCVMRGVMSPGALVDTKRCVDAPSCTAKLLSNQRDFVAHYIHSDHILRNPKQN